MKKIWILLSTLLAFSGIFSQTVPDFIATDVHGVEYHLYDYLDNGKYVLLDFFFTTCPGCQAVAPDLNAAAQRYGCNKGDIVFLGIDRHDTNAEVLAFEQQYGGYYPVISGLDGGGDSIVLQYDINAFPTVVLIAPDKTFIDDNVHPINTHGLDDAISISAGLSENPEACNTTGTGETGNNQEMTISPNPVINTATIRLTPTGKNNAQLTIRNILGQPVTKPIPIPPDYNYISIDMTRLRSGIYFVQLTLDGKIIAAAQKIFKIR